MRVLDLGCGTGDVVMLTADLVSASGSIVGIDQTRTFSPLPESEPSDWKRKRNKPRANTGASRRRGLDRFWSISGHAPKFTQSRMTHTSRRRRAACRAAPTGSP
jgi:hypothetical protein